MVNKTTGEIMARYEVTAPIGQRFEITAPDNATQDQVMEYAKQKFSLSEKQNTESNNTNDVSFFDRLLTAGGPSAASRIGAGMNPSYGATQEQDQLSQQALSDLEKTNPYQAQVIRDTGALGRLGAGFQIGLREDARGVGLGGADDEALAAEKALTESSVLARIGSLAGNVAPFLPVSLAAGGIASLPLRTAAQSTIGAVEGGIVSSGTGGDYADIIKSSLAGAAIGGGAEILGSAVNSAGSALIAKYGKRGSALDSAGNPTPELKDALQQEGVSFDQLVGDVESVITRESGELTPERAARNQAREDAFRRFGLEPTEAQRTRDKSLFIEQQDRFKTGGPVTERLEGQEQALSESVTQAVKNTNGSPVDVATSPIQAVVNRSLKEDAEISDLYKSARESAPTAKNVKFNNASMVLRKYAGDDQLSGGVISSLRSSMERNGALTGFNPTGRMSVDSAEKFRQEANSIFPSTNDRGKMILREFKDAIDKDTGAAVGEDWYKQARSAKAKFESGLDREKFNKFDERKVNLVRDILNNKITPDQIEKGSLIRSGSKYQAQDLSDLKRYLMSGDAEDQIAGIKAWNDIRASAMQSIKDKAFVGAETELGTKQLSRAKLEDAIKEIGRQKFNVLFDQQEQKFLKDLTELARYKEAPSGTALGSGPTGAAIERLESKVESIFGVRIPIASTIKGKISDRKILKLNDDIAALERKKLQAILRPYTSISATAIALPAAAQSGENEQ
jgi:hypothetical protein